MLKHLKKCPFHFSLYEAMYTDVVLAMYVYSLLIYYALHYLVKLAYNIFRTNPK